MNFFQLGLEKHKERNILAGEECMDIMEYDEEKVFLIFDKAGGKNGTITKRAWNVLKDIKYQQELCEYHYKS